MRSFASVSLLIPLFLLFGAPLCCAEGPEVFSAVGTVEKAEKESLRIGLGPTQRKAVVLKITGTSTVRLVAPQVRADKTVMTQRTAEVVDLVPGQAIAIIYTVVDKELILLSAVAKPVDKK